MTCRHHYRAFGWNLAADRELPFECLPEAAPIDLRILEDTSLPYSAARPGNRIHQVRDFPGGPSLLIYHDDPSGLVHIDYDVWLVRFYTSSSAIVYARRRGEALTHFPLVMERVIAPLYTLLSLPGALGVHGSAVDTAQGAWVFIGESGAGKSTTAHQLLSQGARLIADDMTIIDLAQMQLRAGAPALRLWKASGEADGAIWDLPIGSYTPKRWFRIESGLATTASPKLAGIVLLEPHQEAALEPTFERLRGQRALVSLLRQTFDFSNPSSQWMKRRFRNARRLLDDVPLFRFSFARSPEGAPTHVEPLYNFLDRCYESV